MVLQPHIRCDVHHAARFAILPGDPARVEQVAQMLEDVVPIAFHREHKSLRGTYKGLPVLVVSTGMGGASTGIAVEELYRIGVRTMIRIGSCGALQPEIELGDLILLTGVVRDEGTSKAYIDSIFPAVPNFEILAALKKVAEVQGFRHHVGLGRSHDSFYTVQEEEIDAYWSARGILGCDMESAALFTIGHLRKIRTGAILNTVARYQGDLGEDIKAYQDGQTATAQGEKNEIFTALEAISLLAKEDNNHEMAK